MTNPVLQMAAMSAAARMLLAGHNLKKPDDVLIAACTGGPGRYVQTMMAHAAQRRSTLLLIFSVIEETPFLDRIMVVDASTEKNQINIGGGKFVQKLDGSFAVLSINRDEPYEYGFSRCGSRLERRPLGPINDRAVMELRGLQTLINKSATAACQAEARSASISQ